MVNPPQDPTDRPTDLDATGTEATKPAGHDPEYLPPGTRVGHYEIVNLIGRGGMAVVYRARDLKLDRQVALKRPLKRFLANPKVRKRFHREARAASRLQHPHNVTIFEVFEEDGHDWLAMEVIEGQSLRRVLAEYGAMNPLEMLRHAEGLADVLRAAHSQHIIHRDITPNNILIDQRGLARLTDFGLASFQAPADEDSEESRSKSLTESGQVVGTPAYMSPEQALGKRVDKRSDIFALGTVLYEMCSGESPFSAGEEGSLLNSILHHEPEPLSRTNPEVTTEQERIISKCLAKFPDERYQDARDLLADLRAERRKIQSKEYASEHSRDDHPKPDARPALFWAATAVVLTVAVGYLAYLFFREPVLPQGRPSQLTAAPGWEADAVISPDGQSVVYASDESGNADLWLIDIQGGDPLRLTSDPGSDRDPSWLPDGSAIVFSSERSGNPAIWKVPRLGGSAMMLLPDATEPAVAPDGKRIAFTKITEDGQLRIAVSNLAEPTRHEVLTGPGDGRWLQSEPAWSPDGKWLCYADFLDLWLVPAAGGEARRLTSQSEGDHNPVWSSDGRFIIFASHREGTLALWRVRVSGGEPQRLTVGTGPERHPSVSRDGKRIVYTTFDDDLDVMLLDRLATRQTRLPGFRTDYGATFVPEHSAVVFASNRAGPFNLWRLPLDGIEGSGPAVRLNEESAESSNADVSPDGRWVAYQRRDGDSRNIWIVPSVGGLPEPFTEGPGVRIHPSWSPDGSTLAFIAEREDWSDLCLTPVRDGRPAGEPRCLRTGDQHVMWAEWSADGRSIAYLGGANAAWDVWVTSVDGGTPPRQVTFGADGRHLRWLPESGRLLVSGRWGEETVTLREVDPVTGQSTPLDPPIDFGQAARYGLFDVALDGRLLALTYEEVRGDVWLLEATTGSF
jgi:Tol biopolymer transport system component/tRNA A-37 threonylcarbamoyl transferase component Bud32